MTTPASTVQLFCGMDAATGAMTPSPEGTCGYCGPECPHCNGTFVIQDGVWVCAADYDYERNSDV